MTHKNTDQYDWSELNGMTEEEAESYMLDKWGNIPPKWNDPLFRDEITGLRGQAELSAHMNFGEQAYGGESRLGGNAPGVWHLRNIAGQGHPAEKDWLKNKKGNPIVGGEHKG